MKGHIKDVSPDRPKGKNGRMRASINKVRSTFGNPKPPREITQLPFDHDSAHYPRLCGTATHQPGGSDYCDYALDLQYMDLQKDLFNFLFPKCLEAWQIDLMANQCTEYGGFREQFTPGLVHGKALTAEMMNKEQYEASKEFMEDVILDRMDQETILKFEGMDSSPYKWVAALSTFGLVFTGIEKIWEQWWEISTHGHACCILQYISCLMYGEKDNPIFAPYTRKKGGGPPQLWGNDAHLHTETWSPENALFLKEFLTLDRIRFGLENAAKKVEGKDNCDAAKELVADFPIAEDDVKNRAAALAIIMEINSHQVYYWDEYLLAIETKCLKKEKS
jgi:hypothetical protein